MKGRLSVDDEKKADELPGEAVTEEVEEAPKKRARRKKAEPHEMAGAVVRGAGRAYWLVDERGKRRLIPTIEHFYKIGLRKVHKLTEEQLAELPEGWPLR
jgi:hypothetical protein